MSESKLPPGPWHEPGATRIPPPPKNQVGFVPKSLLAMIKRKAGVKGDLNFMSILPRLGPIFVHWALFGGQLLMKGRISRADKERIILRTVWRLGCIYEWGHHVRFARELGVTDAEISSLAEEQSGLWSARTRALVMARAVRPVPAAMGQQHCRVVTGRQRCTCRTATVRPRSPRCM